MTEATKSNERHPQPDRHDAGDGYAGPHGAGGARHDAGDGRAVPYDAGDAPHTARDGRAACVK